MYITQHTKENRFFIWCLAVSIFLTEMLLSPPLIFQPDSIFGKLALAWQAIPGKGSKQLLMMRPVASNVDS